MPQLTLYYFNSFGRAEVARMLLDAGGVPFQDVHVRGEQWQALKARSPYGQAPILEVDGRLIAQSAAIARYCARLAGLLPADDYQAALCDEVYETATEMFDMLVATVWGVDEATRLPARQELIAEGGALRQKLAALDRRLGEIASDAFVGGEQPSHGDCAVLYTCAWMTSGTLDGRNDSGIPRDLLEPFQSIRALNQRVASVAAIRKRYENRDDLISQAMLPRI